ncbi:alpha/beta hydrolase [Streptomyces sp. NPDC002935]|uniref:alpha/beta fold hydrolase n=1 Tax=Streptomyces sp. NPDC002935 TaxID=3154545 RepID=UPI0033B83277
MIGEPIELAVHDHGGDGPPLLLIHGAARTLADWAAVAPLLVPRHRVLAVDLRGHGRSPAGTWSLPEVLADLQRVLETYGIPHALPVGHSLGGMLAVLHASRHPDVTPGAVNLDGYGWGRPDQYVGLDPAYVRERLIQIRELAQARTGLPLSADGLRELLDQQRATSEQLGIPYELLEASAVRSLRERPDGGLDVGPRREHALEMLDTIDSLDLFALFRGAPVPQLHGRAVRPLPPVPGLDWFAALTAAYARGLARDLAQLASERADVTVAEIDGTHAMLLENPRAVADAVLAFTATTNPLPE